jgi:replicative DNA helicase
MFNFSQPIDPVTVLDKMKERGVYDETRTTSYIAQLMEITPTAANVKQYCAIVRDKALLRNLSQAGGDIVDTVNEGVGTASEILEAAEKKIYALRKGNSGESSSTSARSFSRCYDRLTELCESGSDIPGLSTGMHDLDRVINGLNKTDLILHRGPSRHGQDLHGAEHRAERRQAVPQTVAFFSLEMSREQLVMRLLSNEASWTTRSSSRAALHR